METFKRKLELRFFFFSLTNLRWFEIIKMYYKTSYLLLAATGPMSNFMTTKVSAVSNFKTS